MSKQSSGILLYRLANGKLEVLLVHPGGPFWKKKDEGAWSIPKGEFEENEDSLEAAKREIKEEIGYVAEGDFKKLLPVKQSSGKVVHAWAVAGDCDATTIVSNTFEMEWPPRSGKKQSFPEVDRAEWMSPAKAKNKVNPAQRAFIDELCSLLEIPKEELAGEEIASETQPKKKDAPQGSLF